MRLAVIRDGDEYKNRLRLLVPFSVERPAVPLGVSIMRTWSSPFGPLGTPLRRPRRSGRRDRGLLRHAVAAASEAAEGARAARHAARRRRRLACCASVAESRGLPLVTTGACRAAVPGKRARRRRLSEGVAALAPLSRIPPAEAPARRPGRTGAQRRPRPGRDPPRHRGLPVAGSRRLEGPRAHRHGDRPLPRRLRPRGGARPGRAGSVPHPFADAGRQADRQPDRLRRGRRRLHLEDRL